LSLFFRLDARLVVDDIAIGIDQFAYASVNFTENPDLKMHHFAMSIVFAIVLLEPPCLQGQLSLCLLTKFTFRYQI